MSLLVVGTVAFDAIETPYDKVDRIVGGSALFICLSAAQFTNDLRLVSVIGDDYEMDKIDTLKSKGVDVEGLQIKEGEKSFFWSGKYHDDMNGRDTLITDLNVLAEFDPIIPESFRDSEYLMLGNIDPNLQLSVINQMSKRPKLIMLDTMNFWMTEPWRPVLMDVITKIDVLTINDEEARLLSGEHSLVKAAKAIAKMGPKYLIIKKGEHGALLFAEDKIFFAPALPLEVVFDPTGAGDTFAGGVMGLIAKTGDASYENMKRGIIYGSAMASMCVEKFGPNRLLEISGDDLEARVQKFVDLVDFDAASLKTA